MKFEKGNKLAKGGRRNPPGGRPSKEEVAAKKVAVERARERIEAEVDAVMNEYLRLATGGKIKRGSSPQTVRHCVERWLPAARQGIDISIDSPEEFWRAYAALKATPQQKPAPMGLIPDKGALQG
jgi:hypothetical protein